MSKHLVIAAGGTGGHMFPAQALAEEILGRGWSVALSTDDRGLRYAGGFPDAVERRETRSATFSRGGLAGKLAAPFQILSGARETITWFEQRRPHLVAGFGGYPSLPALTAAWRLGIPRIIHEQNGVLGQVNRLFATRVDALAIGVASLSNAPQGAKTVFTGNPLRQSALDQVGRPYAPPGADAAVNILVFGGSQGASIFAKAVPPAIASLPTALRIRLRVAQQTRPENHAEVDRAYKTAGVAAELSDFFDDMPRRIAEAHLVICRAGASTVAEISAIGRPAVLAPYPEATADHQTANARALSEAGAAELVPDAALGEHLGGLLARLLGDPGRLARMAIRAASLGRPDAAEALADLVERLAAPV